MEDQHEPAPCPRPGSRGPCRTGWLYLASRLRQRSDKPDRDAPALPHPDRLRARDVGRAGAARPRHPPLDPLPQRCRPDRGRPPAARPFRLRDLRGGGTCPWLDDAAVPAGRHPAGACALPRRRAGRAGRCRRDGAAVHVECRHHQPAHRRRHAAAPRRHHPRRITACAGGPLLRPARARRFRGAALAGLLRSRGDATADPGPHARGVDLGAARTGGEGTDRGPGAATSSPAAPTSAGASWPPRSRNGGR